jgi:hypothetical protein
MESVCALLMTIAIATMQELIIFNLFYFLIYSYFILYIKIPMLGGSLSP